MNKFSKLALSAIIAGTAASAQASLITDWSYVNEAGFSSWSDAAGNVDGAATGITPSGMVNSLPATAGTYTNLAWGEQVFTNGATNGQSQLFVDSPIVGSVETNGGFVNGTDIGHRNFIVGGGDSNLGSATIADALLLTPIAVDGVPTALFPIPAPVLEFSVEFFETPNGVDYDFDPYPNTGNIVLDDTIVCPDGTLNGTGVNADGCADIFVISSETPGLDFEVVGDDLVITTSFIIDNVPDPQAQAVVDALELNIYEYTLTTVLTGLQLVTDAACLSVGEEAGCVGFITPEEQVNVLTAQYSIDARLVPEPVGVAMFGAALLGLAGLRRRKN